MERKLVMQLLDEIKHALINKDIVLAEDILEKYPELINYKTRSGGTLLHDAAKYQSLEFTKILLDLGIDSSVVSPASGNYGTALTCAWAPEIALLLMSYGMEPIIDIEDRKNPLFYHAQYGNYPMIKFWLDYELKNLDSSKKTELINKLAKQLTDLGHNDVIEKLDFDKNRTSNGLKAEDFSLIEYESELIDCIKYIFEKMCKEHKEEHIYAFSISNTDSFESMFFVANTEEDLLRQGNDLETKYSEENWDIWDINDERVAEINISINSFIKSLDDPDEKYKFKERLIQVYIRCMKYLRECHFFNDNILLNVYIREYLSSEDMIEIYQLLNDTTDIKEFYQFMNE